MEERFETKVCPQCGQELFADMMTCYGCLHSFEEPHTPAHSMPPVLAEAVDDLDDIEDNERADARDDDDGSLFSTPLMLRVSTGDAQATIPVPQEGLSIGRDVMCDIVLKSRAVSKRHARVVPLSSGVIVENLGATNPASYKGREIRETAVVKCGESFEICGSTLTVVA